MKRLFPWKESEIEETFSRASGPGGQNVNKVSSRVTLRHIPTNLAVTVQESRSQLQNRDLARERLAHLLQTRQAQAKAAKRHAAEQERRRQSPRPAKLKRQMVEWKRKRSSLKRQRLTIEE